MRYLLLFFVYVLVPALLVYMSFQTPNYFLLFGIGFYFIGVVIAQFKQYIFLPIPIFFCLWYWYTYGFNVRDYVSIYAGLLLTGLLLQECKNIYDRFIRSTLPEQLSNLEYDDKLEELQKRLEEYKLSHPNEKLTQETVEKIRTDVFFK